MMEVIMMLIGLLATIPIALKTADPFLESRFGKHMLNFDSPYSELCATLYIGIPLIIVSLGATAGAGLGTLIFGGN
jgi:hypothetical protein